MSAARCPGCAVPAPGCICAHLRPVPLPFAVVVVRHAAERRKSSGSARLLPRLLARCTLHDWGAPDSVWDAETVGEPGDWLLFPESPDGAHPVTQPGPDAPLRRLIVLDGNWNQARRMSRRVPGVEALPRLALPPPRPDTARLRLPHAPWAMATVEAVARAVESLGAPAAAAHLDAAFAAFVGAQRPSSPRRTGWRGGPSAGPAG